MVDLKGNLLSIGDEVAYIKKEERHIGDKVYQHTSLNTGIITKITSKSIKIDNSIVRHENTCIRIQDPKVYNKVLTIRNKLLNKTTVLVKFDDGKYRELK